MPTPAELAHQARNGRKLTTDELRAVVDAHAAWLRGEEGGTRADLAGANLADANLTRANLMRANLAGADFMDANFMGANFMNATLTGANLVGAYLTGANLADANLADADLTRANLADAYLAGANLAGANLAGASLAGAYLARAKRVASVGPIDGWLVYAVYWDDGPRIQAGCRWFTVAEAREHWGPGCADRREHGDRMLVAVDALLSIGRAHGYPACDDEAAR